MGIETALVGAGLSASTAATVATGVYAAGAAAAVSAAMPKPKTPAIAMPEKPPQASKTADRASALAGNIAASMPGGSLSGNKGTFLTGPSGIDPSSLNLGKNALLGQ